MTTSRLLRFMLMLLAPALVAGAGAWAPARAQAVPDTVCAFDLRRPDFPYIPVCAFPGGYRDSSLIQPRQCVGFWKGPLPDSIREQGRTASVRFLRDRRAELRPDFGGYRIYRVTVSPDTNRMVLIRRFSRQPCLAEGHCDDRTWNFSVIDTTTLQFMCNGQVVHDSVVTFVDPDSSGNYVRECRRLDHLGRCLSPGDSVLRLRPPPGPHNGFRTWYSITYEARNTTLDGNFEDMFIPDTTNIIGPCDIPGDRGTCPNLNHKGRSIAGPVEPTAGPTENLERVVVVPNPYRGAEPWDPPGASEVHFINLPTRARILIYTVAGDLVAALDHNDPVRDFRSWNLKNQEGKDVSSGIYMYRIEAEQLSFQDRFVVIR